MSLRLAPSRSTRRFLRDLNLTQSDPLSLDKKDDLFVHFLLELISDLSEPPSVPVSKFRAPGKKKPLARPQKKAAPVKIDPPAPQHSQTPKSPPNKDPVREEAIDRADFPLIYPLQFHRACSIPLRTAYEIHSLSGHKGTDPTLPARRYLFQWNSSRTRPL